MESPSSWLNAIPLPVMDFFIDAFAGTLGGVAGVWVGAPLDVIKTRLQVSHHLSTSVSQLSTTHATPSSSLSIPFLSSFRSIGRILKQTIAKEGISALFKGSLIASLGQGPNNFIVFGTYGATLDILLTHRKRYSEEIHQLSNESTILSSSSTSVPLIPTYTELYLAGLTAGLLQSFALTPFEYVKVQQQIYQHNSNTKVSLSMKECIKEIIKVKGPLGLFRGLTVTLWRDAPTYGIYFVSFEYTKRFFTTTTNSSSSTDSISPWIILLGGAIAGVSSWTLATPIDVIKSNIQAQPVTSSSPSLSMYTASKLIYSNYGFQGFIRGLGPIVLRSIPTNAVTFLVYEYSLSKFQLIKQYYRQQEILHS